MSKRLSKLGSGNDSKKQRLDVSIESKDFPSTQNAASPTLATDEELWGDEDDAIFLIASQAYEHNESCDLDNYASFARRPHSSTQNPVVNFNLCLTDSKQHKIVGLPQVSSEPPNPGKEQNELSIKTATFYAADTSQTCPSKITNLKKPLTTELNSLLNENFFNDDFEVSNDKQERNIPVDKFKKPLLPENNACGENPEISQISNNNLQTDFNQSNVSTVDSNKQMHNIMKQLMSMRLENDKLKHERDVLLDKYLHKDGEVSIVRNRLKSTQLQIDAIKLEKLQFHEKNQIHWNTTLQLMNRELQNYKSQVEFKNLEISTANERCRMLESSKIKFVDPVQPILDSSSRRLSQKVNLPMRQPVVSKSSYVSTKESTCQTSALNAITLHPPKTPHYPLMSQIHESIFQRQPSGENPMSFSSVKNSTLVEHSRYSFLRKRILNSLNKSQTENKVYETTTKLENIYEDLSKILHVTQEEIVGKNLGIGNALRITLVAKELLIKTLRQLQNWSPKVTAQTLREMDMKYLEISGNQSTVMSNQNVFDKRCWCENEQAIETRRITAFLSIICKSYSLIAEFVMGLKLMKELGTSVDKTFLIALPLCNEYSKDDKQSSRFLEIFLEIAKTVEYIRCSHLFTGLLTSMLLVLKRCIKRTGNPTKCLQNVFNILKQVIFLRPDRTVILEVSKILELLSRNRDFLEILCNDQEVKNVMPDISQGIMLFNSQSCFLQVLCSQMEVSALQLSSAKEIKQVFKLTNGILNLCYGGNCLNIPWASCETDYRCQCSSRIYQCLVVCLHLCIQSYKKHTPYLRDVNLSKKLNSVVRAGIMMLNLCVKKDIDFTTRLGNHEGNFQLFIENCNSMTDYLQFMNIHKEALADLSTGVTIPLFEEQSSSPSEAHNLWEYKFNKFFSAD